MERPPAFLLASSAAAPAAVHTTTAVESELQRQPAAASGAATEEKEEEEEEAWGVIDDDLLARALLPSTTVSVSVYSEIGGRKMCRSVHGPPIGRSIPIRQAGQEGAQGSRSSEQRKGGQAVPDLVDAITQASRTCFRLIVPSLVC